MRKRLIYGSGLLLLVVLFTLIVWQGSFSFGDYQPTSPEQIYAIWAVSTLIFLLTVTLGFMLVRNFVKLWVERRSNREGSRIRSRLVLGALALSCMPVFFSVLFSFYVLNRSLERWFTRPAENIKLNLVEITDAIEREHQAKAKLQAELIAGLPEVRGFVPGQPPDARLERLCSEGGVLEVVLSLPHGQFQICAQKLAPGAPAEAIEIPVPDYPAGTAKLRLTSQAPLDLARIRADIDREIRAYDRVAAEKKRIRFNYLQLLTLITLFILFFATWVALFLAKQISVPIAALLGGANQVRSGNLDYRVRVRAIDELASLVRAFNEMTADLQANGLELDQRRRFIEAILESIPTGVISLSADGRIQLVNRALQGILGTGQPGPNTRVENLFSAEDAKEIRYLMNRARRIGIAATQLDLRTANRKAIPVSVTVAALDDRRTSGFVLVLEDTSDLLRAQKFQAWHEIARRIAHEIKNPLTPIGLCAERITRQLDRPDRGDRDAVLRECAELINTEVHSLKALVDEFSQFARFPAAQPVPSDLNEVVDNALVVFHGRLDGIELLKSLAPGLPQVNIDREQFKRLVINLVDNAAEAMESSPVKSLFISTSSPSPDTVELVVADTGCGVSAEDKEKLFLPYFSTKGRGTGLGLAIVNHIVSDHNAHIRIEDNQPAGARFVVELESFLEPEPRAAGSQAVESRV